MSAPRGNVFRTQVAFRPAARVLAAVFAAICGFPLALVLGNRAPAAMVGIAVAIVLGVIAATLDALALVTVGADGVLVRRLSSRRFLAFRDIADVKEIDGEKLRLSLRSGGHYDLFTHKDENIGKIGYEERCNELFARIRAGIEAHRDDADRARDAEVIADRARDARPAGYRIAEPPTTDELWSVVADSAASPTARAQAAAALRRSTDTRERVRLLRIADDIAEPELARALRVAAEAEAEAEVEAALASVADRGRS